MDIISAESTAMVYIVIRFYLLPPLSVPGGFTIASLVCALFPVPRSLLFTEPLLKGHRDGPDYDGSGHITITALGQTEPVT